MTTETRDHHGKSFTFDWQNAVNDVPPRPGMYWAKQLRPNGKIAEIRLIQWGVGMFGAGWQVLNPETGAYVFEDPETVMAWAEVTSENEGYERCLLQQRP